MTVNYYFYSNKIFKEEGSIVFLKPICSTDSENCIFSGTQKTILQLVKKAVLI